MKNTDHRRTMETGMSTKTLVLGAATLLALAGCKENRSVDRNVIPEAFAVVQGHDPVSEDRDNTYVIELDNEDDTVDLTLDGSTSRDTEGRIVEWLWLSGTRDPSGAAGRYIPPGEDDGWPDDGETTDVTLGQGFWVFHLYVQDNSGSYSAPYSLDITVGDPPPIPQGDGDADGDGDAGAGDGGAAVTSLPQEDGRCENEAAPCPAPNIGEPCCTAPGAGVEGDALENTGRGEGMCGTDIGVVVASLAGVCLQLNQPGEESDECPEVDTGFAVEPGCCTDQGFCASVNATVPLGCTYPIEGRGEPCTPP